MAQSELPGGYTAGAGVVRMPARQREIQFAGEWLVLQQRNHRLCERFAHLVAALDGLDVSGVPSVGLGYRIGNRLDALLAVFRARGDRYRPGPCGERFAAQRGGADCLPGPLLELRGPEEICLRGF